jgi:hypothetical protein
MRRAAVLALATVIIAAVPAFAKIVGISASPNPASVGDRVRHTVEVGTRAPLEVWVSASGFERPGSGTLPAGSWTYECCPAQTAGTPAWHYRSGSIVAPGIYRFGAVARSPGTYLSSAVVAGGSAGVWIRIR